MSGILLITLAVLTAEPADRPSVIVVVGAAGTEEYGREFLSWAERWEQAARAGAARVSVVGRPRAIDPRDAGRSVTPDLTVTDDKPDRRKLQELLADEAHAGSAELWIVLIGHGTFDGQSAKFNLRGPDFSSVELADWLKDFSRPLAIINCASASGPFLNALSAPGRVIVTATKSGFEQNYTRFGGYLAEAVADPDADLDKDGQTSLFEAFLVTSRKCEEFYAVEGRLATEHALLDDNGDKQGIRADWFRGLRPIRKPDVDDAPMDGYRAHQWHLVPSDRERRIPPDLRKKRDELELAVIGLRDRKKEFTEEDYYERLEVLLVQLAEVYEQAERVEAQPSASRPTVLQFGNDQDSPHAGHTAPLEK